MAKNSERKREDNLIPFKKGESGNPNGRPKGQRNFATIYREAIEKIAASKNMTAEDFEIQLAEQALRKAFNGDTRFYTDTMDRVHGKAQQVIDHNIDATVKTIIINKNGSDYKPAP
jgi:predicted outer membrane protein